MLRDSVSSSRRSWLISTMPARSDFSSASSHSIAGRSRWLVGSSSSSRSGDGARARAMRGAALPGRRRASPGLRRRTGRAGRAGRGRGGPSSGPRPGRGVVERGRGSRRGRAPAAGNGRWHPAGGSACRRRAASRPAATFSSVDLPEPLRPTRQMRSPAPTPSSAPCQQRGGAEREPDVLQEQQRAGPCARYGQRRVPVQPGRRVAWTRRKAEGTHMRVVIALLVALALGRRSAGRRDAAHRPAAHALAGAALPRHGARLLSRKRGSTPASASSRRRSRSPRPRWRATWTSASPR